MMIGECAGGTGRGGCDAGNYPSSHRYHLIHLHSRQLLISQLSQEDVDSSPLTGQLGSGYIPLHC
jgi:hypothetical protein